MIGAWYRKFSASYPGVASQLRNGSALAGSQTTEAVLRGIFALLIGALLGPTQYGVWSYVATTYMAALTLTALGLETQLEARLARLGQDRLAFLQMTLAVRLATVALVAAGVAGLAWLTEPDPLVRSALFLTVPALAGRGISGWARSVFTGSERSVQSLRLSLTFRLGEFAIGLALLLAGYGIAALLLLHALSWVGEAIANLVALRRLDPALAPRWHGAQGRMLLQQGALIGFTVAGIGLLNAGPIVLAKFLGLDFAAIGSLGMALQIAMLGIFVVQGFMAASFPLLSRGLERKDRRVLHYGWLSCLLVGFAFASAALLAHWLGGPVIVAIMGADFAPAADLLPLCLLMAGLTIAPMGFWQVLVLHGRTGVGALAALLAALVMLAASAPAATTWGITGLIFAAMAGWVVRGLVLVLAALLVRQPDP